MKVLITTIDEIKERVPGMMATSLGIGEYRAAQTVAEETYLKPYLGDLLDILRDHVAADGSDSGSGEPDTETLDALLELCLDVTVPLMMYEAMPSMEVKVSKAGIHQSTSEQMQPIYSIQRENLQNQLLKQGMTALELLLGWMESHSSELGEWAESEERVARKGLLVQTAKEFTKHFAEMRGKRATYEALLPTMQEVQDTVVRGLLGDDLYDALLTEMESLSGSDTLDAEWEALATRLRPVVAKATAARAMPGLSLSIEAWGIFSPSLMHNERNSKVMGNATDARYIALKEQLELGAEAAKKRVTDYLNANAADYGDLWEAPEEDAPTAPELAVKAHGGSVML